MKRVRGTPVREDERVEGVGRRQEEKNRRQNRKGDLAQNEGHREPHQTVVGHLIKTIRVRVITIRVRGSKGVKNILL